MIYSFEYNKPQYITKIIKSIITFILLQVIFAVSEYRLVNYIIKITNNENTSDLELTKIILLCVLRFVLITICSLIVFSILKQEIKRNLVYLTHGMTGKYNYHSRCNIKLEKEYLSIYNENIENKIYYCDIKSTYVKGQAIIIKSDDDKFMIFKDKETEFLYKELIKIIAK